MRTRGSAHENVPLARLALEEAYIIGAICMRELGVTMPNRTPSEQDRVAVNSRSSAPAVENDDTAQSCWVLCLAPPNVTVLCLGWSHLSQTDGSRWHPDSVDTSQTVFRV